MLWDFFHVVTQAVKKMHIIEAPINIFLRFFSLCSEAANVQRRQQIEDELVDRRKQLEAEMDCAFLLLLLGGQEILYFSLRKQILRHTGQRRDTDQSQHSPCI